MRNLPYICDFKKYLYQSFKEEYILYIYRHIFLKRMCISHRVMIKCTNSNSEDISVM